LIPGFQSLSSYRGFSQRDAFGKTHAWVASPEERRAGDPKTNPFSFKRCQVLWTLSGLIPGFQSPSCYQGFSQKDAFGKTHAWVASPEERRAGDPFTNHC